MRRSHLQRANTQVRWAIYNRLHCPTLQELDELPLSNDSMILIANIDKLHAKLKESLIKDYDAYKERCQKQSP